MDKPESRTIEVRVKDLVPYDRNPRRNDGAVEAVKSSLRTFGYVSRIVVAEDMTVVAGHTRLKAMMELGWEDKIIEVTQYLAAADTVRAFRIADNSTGQIADWDYELLEEEIEELDGFEFEDFGLDMEDVYEATETVEAVEDVPAPEPPEEPVTQRGWIYRLGDHVLMCGDSTSPEDVQRLMRAATGGGGDRYDNDRSALQRGLRGQDLGQDDHRQRRDGIRRVQGVPHKRVQPHGRMPQARRGRVRLACVQEFARIPGRMPDGRHRDQADPDMGQEHLRPRTHGLSLAAGAVLLRMEGGGPALLRLRPGAVHSDRGGAGGHRRTPREARQGDPVRDAGEDPDRRHPREEAQRQRGSSDDEARSSPREAHPQLVPQRGDRHGPVRRLGKHPHGVRAAGTEMRHDGVRPPLRGRDRPQVGGVHRAQGGAGP